MKLIKFAALILFLAISANADTIVVPAGGDLQGAINAAQTGDTIQLAQAVFSCNCVENKGLTIVGPAVIETPNSGPAIYYPPRTPPAVLRNLEIRSAATVSQVFTIVRFGSSGPEQDTLEEVPRGLTIENCDIHGQPTKESQRGIAANGANFVLLNSRVREIHGIGYDTQAVCSWNGPGPFTIIGNFLEAAGENIMFGGADPSIVGLVPSDITIRRNHFFKPLTWKIGHPSYAGIPWTIKNLFETKNARRLLLDGNVLENCWTHAQVGFAIVLKSANQDGACYWCVSAEITVSNNLFKNVERGINILGRDGTNPAIDQNRLRIVNNLWVGLESIWFQGGNGTSDVVVDHNTFFTVNGNTATLYGRVMPGFVATNNLGPRAGFGIKGDATGEGTIALETFCPGYNFRGNIIVGADASIYPLNNFYPASWEQVQLGSDYRLLSTSPFKNSGTDGRDPGVDMDALLAAQAGEPPSPTPTPTPTPVPTPSPTPVPPPVTRRVSWPRKDAEKNKVLAREWLERFRPVDLDEPGDWAIFEKVP